MPKTDNVLIRFQATGLKEINIQLRETLNLLKQINSEKKKSKIKIKAK